jgi:hypothetical protein
MARVTNLAEVTDFRTSVLKGTGFSPYIGVERNEPGL